MVSQLAQDVVDRVAQLRTLRAPRVSRWQDVCTYIAPYSGRFLPQDRDRGPASYRSIIDETGVLAAQTLSSGLMAMRTNPALPWFRYQTPDVDLNKRQQVRKWFAHAEGLSRSVIRRSGAYSVLPHHYLHMGLFGTSGSVTVENFDTVLRHFPATAGEFVLGANGWGEIDTFGREFTLSVAEVVKRFGLDAVSKTVQALHRGKQLDAKVDIVHLIEPRVDRDPELRDKQNMPWRDVYLEKSEGHVLSEGGHRRFPAITPRWDVTGDNVWGDGPGDIALGSTKQLQIEQIRKAETIDYQTRPVLQVPSQLAGRDRDLLPGGRVPYDQATPNSGVRTAFEVTSRIDYLLADIEDVRRRINEAYHVPMFRALSMLDASTQRTQLEIFERKQEAMMLLGPVTQRLQTELDDPLIQTVFDQLVLRQMLPPPPPELAGVPMEIEFIGPLAQALKRVGAQSTDQFTARLGIIAQMKPTVLDKFDEDKWVDAYADAYGVDPDMIVANEQVALLRESRNAALAAKEQSAMMAEQAKTAQTLGSTRTDEPTLLTQAQGASV